jgi:hypothetical protein
MFLASPYGGSVKKMSPLEAMARSLGEFEALAVVLVDEHHLLAVGLGQRGEAREAAIAVLAHDEVALLVHGEAVRAGLLHVGARAVVAGGREEEADALAVLPLVDRVARDLGEEQDKPPFFTQTGPSIQSKFSASFSQLGVRRQQLVERGVEPLDGAEAGVRRGQRLGRTDGGTWVAAGAGGGAGGAAEAGRASATPRAAMRSSWRGNLPQGRDRA